MRKHDVRKWLHAILDLLPVILIPVFMIYSHRHDVAQDFEVVTEEPIYYETNEVNNIDDIVIGNYYRWNDNYTFSSTSGNIRMLELLNNSDLRLQLSIPNEYSDCICYLVNNNTVNTLRVDFWRNGGYVYGIGLQTQVFDFNVVSIITSTELSYYISYISECHAQYIKDYQEIITTIPKDVMTSFMDRFNNTIDQYFNMGNVFNLNGVYEWFNINIFSGHAPTVIYSIWNIALYELVMDLLFLLYGLFMWFIDMVEKLMDKPFKSIK